MLSQRILRLGVVPLFFACVSCSSTSPAGSRKGVQLTSLSDRVQVNLDGQVFTEYFFKNVPRPFCYPLIGPGQTPLTRNWPMKTTPDEDHDHPHHRSLWFAHGSVNGHDFWSEEKSFGKIVHDHFEKVESGKNAGIIVARNNWVAADGTVICTDKQTLRFYKPAGSDERMLDFEETLYASNGPLTLGDTKEGTMAIRVAETMRLKGKVGHGHIVESTGLRDEATWGKRAEWCDYYGPVEGKTVGIALFDHPDNPRHPTWWHVRDYGLFAANPFGRHDFEGLKDKQAGNLTIPAGQSVTFRYRFYFHTGDEQQAKVAEKYRDYVKSVHGK